MSDKLNYKMLFKLQWSFPRRHRFDNVGIFVQLLMENKLGMVTSWINFDANLHLPWCLQIKLMSPITSSLELIFKFKQKKNANIVLLQENANAPPHSAMLCQHFITKRIIIWLLFKRFLTQWSFSWMEQNFHWTQWIQQIWLIMHEFGSI